MVREPLSAEMIDAGSHLLAILDQEHIPACGVFWFFDLNDGQWFLVLALPLYDSFGPRITYAKVRGLLQNHQEQVSLRLRDIRLVSPDDPLVRALTSSVKIGIGGGRVRLHQSRLNDVYVEDMLVYRSAADARATYQRQSA